MALRESTTFRTVPFGGTLAKTCHKIVVLSDPLFLEIENWTGKHVCCFRVPRLGTSLQYVV